MTGSSSDNNAVDALLTRRVVPAEERANFKPIDLDSLIRKTDFLPPSFELIPRLLLLLDNADVNCEDLADIIRVDASLTADVLRISNGASFGGAHKTDSLSEAIIRVGLREIYRTVMKIVTSPALTSPDAFDFQRVDLWRHSLATAVAAQVLTRHLTSEDPEVSFTAGLLHDIGKVLLAHAAGADYLYVLEACAQSSRIVHRAEREAFRVDHLEAAQRLLRHWKFPPHITSAIVNHHSPTAAAENDAKLAALLYAGNILAYRIGQGNGYPVYSIHPDPAALRIIDLDSKTLETFEDEVRELLRREQERLW
jgi:putative nucleotidyltransferase with HDIG domain